MKNKLIAVAGLSCVLVAAALAAETTEKPSSPEATAITNQIADYVKAYNAGDAKALAQYFADDAEYTDENGELTQGRADIQQLLTDTLAENKGSPLEIQADAVRTLGT